jgi:hypothetical protein
MSRKNEVERTGIEPVTSGLQSATDVHALPHRAA